MDAAGQAGDVAAPGTGRWSAASLRALLEGLPDAVVGADRSGTVVLVNALAEDLFGRRRDDLLGRPVQLLWPVATRERYTRNMELYFALEQPMSFTHEAHGLRADGTEFEGEMSWGIVETDEGPLLLAIGRDVSDRREADRRLRRWSLQQAAVARLGQRALAGAEPSALEREAEERIVDALGAARAEVRHRDGPPAAPGEVEVSLAAGDLVLGRLVVAPGGGGAFGDEERAFLQAIANVLTAAVERRAGEERIRHQALHDELTGLANRALCRDRLEHALARATRAGGAAAVLALDIDGFKRVNDLHGHAVGDEVLAALARRLVSAVRPADTVARLGGDEFVVVCEDVDERTALQLAERVAAAVRRPLDAGATTHALTASVGVALGTGGTTGPDRLVADADAAAYRAKVAGRGRVELFDEHLRRRVRQRVRLEADLERAIERDELALVLQPIVSLRDGSIAGHEALLRWEPPQGRTAPPIEEVIALAEESSLILRVGAWALRDACRRAAAMDGPAPPWISVNVSGRQLAEPGFARVVADALERSGLPAQRLHVEVTETTLLQVGGTALETIDALGRLGVRLALDDFGTGWSSLELLRRLPVDMLKIDRSFVRNVAHDAHDAAIVKAVVSMATALGIRAVAEGVEDGAQAARLRALGCPLAQGFHFGHPVG